MSQQNQRNIEQLAEQFAELCHQQKLMVTCAESCTGGGIAYALTSVAGSSAWFEQSWVTYANHAKQGLINVSEQTLIDHGAVSQQTVEEMARGAQLNAKADIALVTSGVAGPGGGTAEKPVGTVWFGWAVGEQLFTEKLVFDGDRREIREQAIAHSLQWIIEKLS